jgi:2-aminoadipate transaminase
MNWNTRFSRRTQKMKRSAVREILKVTSRPEIISFAGGLPAAELFPIPQVQKAVAAVFKRVGSRSLQYAETEGMAELREWLAQRYSRPGLKISPENILITSGAQQGLDLIGRVLLDRNDRVLVENPTYLALLSAWRPWDAKFVAVPSDREGMRVETLDAVTSGRTSKVMYLVPNFQNPQGTTLALRRRKRLVNWLRKHEVALVEDDPYGELRYSGEPVPSLFDLDARNTRDGGLDSHVIRTGSFSKVLMPGLRVGWVMAATPVIDKLVQAKQAADLHTSSLSQLIASELVRNGFLDTFIPLLQKTYCERRDTMLAALGRHLSGMATWTEPEGGMFLMVNLPKGIDAAKLLPLALEQKVAFVPGEEFHLNGQGRNTLRLNFSNSKPEAIETGIERLAKVLKQR